MDQLLSLFSKAKHQPFGVWLCVSLLLRAGYVSLLGGDVTLGDAAYYLAEAKIWLEGGWPGDYWPPALPLLLALWQKGFGSGLAGQMGIPLLFWTGVLYQTDRLLVSQSCSIPRRHLLLAILCCWPAFIHHSVLPLTHMPIAFGLLWSLRIWEKRKGRGGMKLGLIQGLMGLFRPAALSLAAFWLWKMGRPGRKSLLFVGGLSLVLLPWIGAVYSHSQAFVFINSASTYNFFLGNQPETPTYRTWELGSHDHRGEPDFLSFYQRLDSIQQLPEAQRPKAYRSSAWEYIQQQPLGFLLRMASRFRTFWAFDTLAGASLWYKGKKAWAILALGGDAVLYFLFMMICAWTLLIQREKRFILPLAASYLLPYLLAFSHANYHFALLPLLLLIGGQRRISDFGHLSVSKKRVLGLIGAILALFCWEWAIKGIG